MAQRCGTSGAMCDAARKPWETAVPVARANRRRASGSLADVPHRLRLPSYPADRPRDLYGSLLRTFGIRSAPSRLKPFSSDNSARLYKRLAVRTQSPMRLMASRNRVISAKPTAGIWSRFHLKRRRTHFMWAYLAGQNVSARSWIGRHHALIGIGFGTMSVDSRQGFARTMGLRNRHLNCKAS